MSFTPVKQNRIAVEIVSQLKAAILSGRFKPGERLPTERELTEQFQVSRVVVREAVRELEIKGLVKILQGPTGGAYVTDLSLDHLNSAFLDLFLYNRVSVAELIQARLLIECEIARIAAGRIEPQSARRLQEALDAEQRDSGSHAEFVSNRLVFHYLLAELSGNRLLQATASALFQLTGEVILEVKPVKKVIHRPKEHAEILRALLDHDRHAAALAMQRHLESMGQQLARLEGLYRKRRGTRISNLIPANRGWEVAGDID
ncbi:MAG: FadR family transcriptional regulator [Desulfobacterales bacterium]|jgi:DNA-binding FadR family transcriptional regulator|nr:FadR family transcriptional regulator [Desulfobacterales bacterium]